MSGVDRVLALAYLTHSNGRVGIRGVEEPVRHSRHCPDTSPCDPLVARWAAQQRLTAIAGQRRRAEIETASPRVPSTRILRYLELDSQWSNRRANDDEARELD